MTSAVLKMIDLGVRLDYEDICNRNVIHYASFHNQPSIIRKCYEKKMDLNQGDIQENTPLMLAVKNLATEAVRELINIHKENKEAVLIDKMNQQNFTPY